MGVKEEVLRALRADEDGYVSGQALADGLGVSRHAVWKAIDRLRSEGYEIEARKNCGYKLLGTSDALSAEGVAVHLATDAPFRIEYHSLIDSTNNRARDLAEAGADEWTVVLADAQTAGRGRMGRPFYSPQASGIYMSVIVRPQCEAAHANMLTLAAAAAVAEAIEDVCGVQAQIKWVNDLFVEGRKICGILTEASVGLEEQQLRYAVVGIGINVAPPAGGVPEGLADVMTSIYQSPRTTETRNLLVAAILERFRGYADNLLARDFLASYRDHLMVIGKRVRLVRGAEDEWVLVQALTDDGALVVECDDGSIKEVFSGEVSLRFQ
ncbi:MAG: biotin--[acetyl-CoA-carboxylase] ligase [Peptococcaceae bacterium]|nr:biotin--[acetyl-CoA-carboxylase] ligase [Peptococcaceae bacterium]